LKKLTSLFLKKYLCLIISISFLLVINACSSERVKPKINTALDIEELPSQESWNSTIYFTDSGKVKAVLWVGHLQVYSQKMETLIDSNLKVDFYNEYEQKTSTLTAKRGKVDDRTRDLYAYDNVVAKNDSGVTLTTNQLKWINKDAKIISDDFVKIITPTEQIEGYGFESDQHIRNYVIRRITYVTTFTQ